MYFDSEFETRTNDFKFTNVLYTISSIFYELSLVCVCSRLETYSKLNEIDVDSTVAFKLKGNHKETLIRNIV